MKTQHTYKKVGWDEELEYLAEQAGVPVTREVIEELSDAAHDAIDKELESLKEAVANIQIEAGL